MVSLEQAKMFANDLARGADSPWFVYHIRGDKYAALSEPNWQGQEPVYTAQPVPYTHKRTCVCHCGHTHEVVITPGTKTEGE